MESERRKKYTQKLNLIVEKLSSIIEKPTDKLELDASLYRMQVAIDAAMDVVAMFVKDLGLEVSDDYHNLELLEQNKVIPAELGDELRKANGLRNAIVHKYNSFEEDLALRRIPTVKKALKKLALIIEEKI